MSFHKRVLATVCLMVVGLATVVAGFALAGTRRPEGRAPEWSEGLIRIHVIANSDTDADQALKRAVRDAVLTKMAPVFEQAETEEEAAAAVRSNLLVMEETAAEVIRSWGADYPVRAQFGRFMFSDRSLGDLFLPAGEYSALRIVIGAGAGQNWWSVLFPDSGFKSFTHEIYIELPDGKRVKPYYLDERAWREMQFEFRTPILDAIKAWWNS